MKIFLRRFGAYALALPISFLFLPQAVFAADETGLWIGEVTVDAVSGVNRPVTDLSFDLKLSGVLSEETLIATGSSWRWSTASDLGIAWREQAYGDGSWSTGNAPLGHGAEQGVLGTDVGGSETTAYFRQSFVIVDVADYSGLRLRYRRDDGIAVYLNGTLLHLENLPSSFIDHDTNALVAVTGAEATEFQELELPASLLRDGSNLIAVEVHTVADDSDLGFDMELLGLRSDPVTGTLVPSRASGWSYYDTGDELPATWISVGYGEPGWSGGGAAPLGFGDGDEQTVISSGPSASEKNPVTYFRKTFTVVDASQISHLDIALQRDDGAVVYVNGVEMLRSNMPGGAIEYTSRPVINVASEDESTYFSEQVPASSLVDGTNVVAVAVYQHAAELTPFEGTEPPSAVASPLGLRLILHVDDGGDVKLLKQVIQMWQDGTLNGDGTLAESGRYVLVTRDEKIPDFKGVALRDGELAGRRISSVGFDFAGDELDLSGSLQNGSTISGTVNVEPTLATHPRRHKFHPDHDNLDATYTEARPEFGTISRSLSLQISDRYPADPSQTEITPAPPGWGEEQIGGTYTETLTGLHRFPITVQGYFTLNRVTTTGALNE